MAARTTHRARGSMQAAALALSVTLAPGALRAQQSRSSGMPRETGQFSVGGAVVWLRVTDDGTVLVYAARGYRSAFVHPAVIKADDADRWADAAARLMAADSGGTTSRSRTGAPAHSDTSRVHLSLGDGDILVETELEGNAPMLIAQIGVHEPDKQVVHMPVMALEPVISTLRESARVARRVQAASLASAPPAAAPATTPAAPSTSRVSAGGAPPPMTPARPTPAAAQRPWRADSTGTVASVRTVSAPMESQAPVTPVLPAPAKPSVPAPVKRGTARSADPHIGAVENAPDSKIAYAARSTEPPPVDSGHAKPAAAKTDSALETSQTKSKTGSRAPGPAVTAAPPHSSSNSSTPGAAAVSTGTDSIAERALTTAGRLPPSALGDAIRQREQLLQFCYTEYGLRVDPNLAGQIVVRIGIQQTGTVSDVTIAHRSWSGRAADEVESCIRKRVANWQFPSAERASTHEIQLIFGR